MWTAKLGKDSSSLAMSKVLTPSVGKRFTGLLLGIDPSLRGTGLAVVEVRGVESFHLLASETVKLPTKATMVECLGEIGKRVCALLARYEVGHISVEETIYVQNFKTAQIMGMARGAALASAALSDKPIFEYSPLRIKQSVAGFGRASKEQVAGQTQALLGLKEALPFDESDAAAVAICHALTHRLS